MKIYIRSTTNISPQKTFKNPEFLTEPVSYTGNRLTSIEPDYKAYIDSKMIRRMSRVIKMGVAAGLECLKQANIDQPDAIVTGTAYGCLEDTGVFLTNMVEQDEDAIAPTAFVHSTHNTIGAQIALLIQCKQYNNTFVSGGASFENALLDAWLLISDGDAKNVLVGGIDEITDVSQAILRRMGLYKRLPINNIDMFNSTSKGTIAGEGAAFFLLTGTESEDNIAQLEAIASFYKPDDITDTGQQISNFLSAQAVNAKDIDLVIMGNNGDAANDVVYTELQQTVFSNLTSITYKHLCGEYPTATGFALWLSVNIFKNNEIPAVLGNHPSGKISRVLIYNHYQNVHHSLMLVSGC